MNLNEFPSSPSEGDTYLVGNVTYKYTQGVWDVVSRVKSNIRALVERQCAEAGLVLVAGSFEEGGAISASNEVLWCMTDTKVYGWRTNEAKTVPANSTPATSGGIGAGAWVDRTDLTLRSEINPVQRRFSTVAEMKSLLTTDDIGKVVEWIGYYSTYDSGGNTGIVVAAGTGTPDNFSYIEASSGVQVQALFADGRYTLKRAGVKADGVTDDTLAITNADAHVKSISKKLIINGSGLIKYSSLTLTSDLIPDSGIFDVTNSNVIDISGKISLSRNQMFDITGLTPSDHNTEFPVKIRSRRCQPEWFGAKTVLDQDLIKTVPDSTSFIMASLRAVAGELELSDIIYDTSYTNYINKNRGTVVLDAADYRVDGHILLGTTNESLVYKYWFSGIGIQGLDGAMELTRLIRTDLDTTDKLLTFQFITNEPHTIKNFKIIGYNPDAVAKYTSKAKSLFELITGNAAICSNLWIAGAQYDQGTGLDGVGIFVANMAEVTFSNVMSEQNQVNWSISRSTVNINNCFSYFAYRSLFELGASLSGWESNNTAGITIVNGSNLVLRNNSPLGITNKAYDARVNLSNVVLEAKDEAGGFIGDYAIYAYDGSNLSGDIYGIQITGFLKGMLKTIGEGAFGKNSSLNVRGIICKNTGTRFNVAAGLIDSSTNTTNICSIHIDDLDISGLNNLLVRGRYEHITVNNVDFNNLIGGGNSSGESLFSMSSVDKGEFKNWKRKGTITTITQTGYVGAGDLIVDRIAMSSVGTGITGAASVYKYTTTTYS